MCECVDECVSVCVCDYVVMVFQTTELNWPTEERACWGAHQRGRPQQRAAELLRGVTLARTLQPASTSWPSNGDTFLNHPGFARPVLREPRWRNVPVFPDGRF